MKTCLLILGCWVLLLLSRQLAAQEASSVQSFFYSTKSPEEAILDTSSNAEFTIREISVSGIKRTRRSTVLRELSFSDGEAYPLPAIIEKLEQSKRQLMNTSLFRTVEVTLRSLQGQDVYINVDVEERWYFYPQPFVRVANGTFSQWNERGRKLEHLNYGIKLSQFNFSGRGDKMHLHLANGYTKKFTLQYQGFFLDKELKWSSSVNFTHGKNRELNYATENNKLLPVKNPDGYLYEFVESSVDVMYRPAIKTKHTFTAGFNYNRVADTVMKLNASYAPANNSFSYPYFTYNLSFLDLDFNPYPTKGRRGNVALHKAGFGGAINLWQLTATGSNYWTLGSKSYFGLTVGGVVKLPFRQPYITQRFMGYGDAYLQGYENYIVDGVAGGYTKAMVGYNVLKTEIPLPTNKLFKSLRSVPLKVYAKTYVNAGYSYNPNSSQHFNQLNNKMLYSGGFGLDIIAFADLIFKIEWSFNQLGQNGIYLHQ
ncbi:MAG TPA: POTRA domain-containing protein [Flavisolibacter sp.]|jgi:outer membrane protein assembly factor BamA|nr:POTRA domain-containing protein [Flavisolibacter sp.]